MKKAITAFIIIATVAFTTMAIYQSPNTLKTSTNKIEIGADSVLICDSENAYAYHHHVCKGLARCTHGIYKIPKSEALRLGLKPCKTCY